MAVGYNDTQDPRKLTQNQRALIQSRGDELNQENKDLGNQGRDISAGYRGFLDPIEQKLASGQGGYTDEEAAAIRGDAGPYGLNSLPTSDQDLRGNFLTGGEEAGIRGNTGSYTDFFNPDQMHDSLVGNQGNQDVAVGTLRKDLGNSIRPNDLRQSQDYRDAQHDQINANQSGVRGALGGETSAVRRAIDPAALKQSADAARNEVMTPEEEQRMVTGAGISAGVRNQAAVGALGRQARAAGSSPMGVAAYRARMNKETAAEAGDEMTKARVAAQQARAGESLSAEQQRLMAQQGLTNVQTGTELDLGKQGLQSEQALGEQALAQRNAQEQNRQAAEQYLTGAEMQSATTGGEAELQNAQQKTGQEQQQNQFTAGTGTGIRQAQDTADSGRAATVATNRQNTGEGNQAQRFNQGMTVNNAASGRGAKIGDTRIGQQDTGLQLQQGQQGMSDANSNAAYGRQMTGYGTQTSGTNQAAGQQLNAQGIPTTKDKIIGGISGAIGAAASFLDEGGIATEPTLAVVGEHGPEMVMPIDGGYRARLPRPITQPKRYGRAPMRYGQEVA